MCSGQNRKHYGIDSRLVTLNRLTRSARHSRTTTWRVKLKFYQKYCANMEIEVIKCKGVWGNKPINLIWIFFNTKSYRLKTRGAFPRWNVSCCIFMRLPLKSCPSWLAQRASLHLIGQWPLLRDCYKLEWNLKRSTIASRSNHVSIGIANGRSWMINIKPQHVNSFFPCRIWAQTDHLSLLIWFVLAIENKDSSLPRYLF